VSPDEIAEALTAGLNPEQRASVTSPSRLLGVVAGAGSGKTEVMSRRVAWWVSKESVPRGNIIAFTFTEAAAEELKFRVRQKLQILCSLQEEATLSGMYVGTIHGFCLKCLREFAPDEYYSFDVLDDAGRMSVVQQGFFHILALQPFVNAARATGAAAGQSAAVALFLRSYDILNEHVLLKVKGPEVLPSRIEDERDWCHQFELDMNVGDSELNATFAKSAARYYAYLRARRFLDFSTAQAEFVRKLHNDEKFRERFRDTFSHMVVDEVQDINPAQLAIINTLIEDGGHLTAVGDHRQAIYSFRGGRVDLMGDLFASIEGAPDGKVLSLPENYRSTERIIRVANEWADTIDDTYGLPSPHMTEGVSKRVDSRPVHVAVCKFDSRREEATWIVDTIEQLIPSSKPELGALHGEGEDQRGISYGDVAILVRSSTDIASYQDALRARNIYPVVRGGADLFSQVEVLLFLSALSLASGTEEYVGGQMATSLPSRVQNFLGTQPRHVMVIPAALERLRLRGLHIPDGIGAKLLALCHLIHRRVTEDGSLGDKRIAAVKNPQARKWLGSNRKPRRIFPQTIFQWILEEAAFGEWAEVGDAQYETVRFHVGQLSTLLKGMESSGWTGSDENFKYQLIALVLWGSRGARVPEAPLLVPPNAITITTIHSSKGLEFPVVFVADICPARFPSNKAKVRPKFAFDENVVDGIDSARLADNDNYDDERRLMYVALTRAERFLFASASGTNKSKFMKELSPIFQKVGGSPGDAPPEIQDTFELSQRAPKREDRLSTSFSDLRYFLECPQDFFIRKVLGFTPPIGQEFGYGRGVHNLLRAIHERPAHWAEVAKNEAQLQNAIEALVDKGLFYLRYTVGDPYKNLRNKAVQGVREYVRAFVGELTHLQFEPERPFETLFPEQGVLISGAIDVVRRDDPPRVTLIDFKSGNAAGENASGLSSEMMAMQLGVYGIAAKKELQYEPEQGLVRYIGEDDPAKREVKVALSDKELTDVRSSVVTTAGAIKARQFKTGPAAGLEKRCGHCDFGRICAMPCARQARKAD
jgi:DNA helicase-2/ATP-dependent DNA helicase PcrA